MKDYPDLSALTATAEALHVSRAELTEITVLKKGMTNRSWLLSCQGKRYILRVPGEGTDRLIDRKGEAAVYVAIQDTGLGDHLVFLDPETGYKLTEYWENARVCDPARENDVHACIRRLRSFHDLKIRVGHTFDLFGQIDFYEGLRGGESSYQDYGQTKMRILAMRPWLEGHARSHVLTHIDAVPDNFLFLPGEDAPRLIDWEYAGMQDPDVDIAMFCIYAGYDRPRTDRAINAYDPEGCKDADRRKIYGYMAAGGLLWSTWCEYKRTLGVEFGAYAQRQYDYAREYAQIWEAMK